MKGHHFMQTELSYNVSKGSISIPSSAENISLLQDNALVKTDIHSIDIPLLYGYKFIDKYPYGMAFFATLRQLIFGKNIVKANIPDFINKASMKK